MTLAQVIERLTLLLEDVEDGELGYPPTSETSKLDREALASALAALRACETAREALATLANAAEMPTCPNTASPKPVRP